ncbi:calcium-binding protein [Poseidonocella sp. HB161398]|uniref:calcium-binding protein n=1 Tax=Poseidonocella sp. HB161398 TaxID=2320855 RepID=UPI001109092E|nr:M10 family metallopeptidase C-terminal domain-containing protein [Poseidonocella sp. HB161398]
MAVLLTGAGSSSFFVFNDGTTFSRNYYGIYATPGASGDVRIANDGRIAAPAPVYVTTGTLTLHNSGLLSAVGESSITHFSIYSSSADDRIENTGSIDGLARTNSGSDYVLNSGDMDGLLMGSGQDTLVNDGGAVGNVDTGSVDDVVRNSGSMGTVSLGSGSDRFDGRGGMLLGPLDAGGDDDIVLIDETEAVVAGGTGIDTLLSWDDALYATGFEEISLRGSADATAVADSSTAVVNGNAGDNLLIGSEIANDMRGKGGKDEICGWEGGDALRGDLGDDFLDGGDDDDTVVGGSGNDTITGGLGTDVLYGQQNADIFVWNNAAEAGTGAARDVLADFQRGTDLIDLGGIEQESFAFLGTGAFTASGGMELRYKLQAGVHAIVQMDTDGDGIADGEIRLRGITGLDAGDFIL